MVKLHLAPAMPRQRYRQNPLPLGPEAPGSVLYGPEPPPSLQLVQQGQLGVVPLGPLFDDAGARDTAGG